MNNFYTALGVAVTFVGGLSGCAHKQLPLTTTDRLVVIKDERVLPAPSRSDLVPGDRPSLIGALDTIVVDVFNVPGFNREIQVDASGRIALPLVGTLEARGQTSEELTRTIRTALRAHFIRDPQVTVNLKNSISQVVTVDGQVTEPGLYPVTNQMTLMRAIASAKGLSEFAREDDVVILRTVNSQKMAGLYNITAIRRGAYDDPPIYANDIIQVGDSPARRRFRDFVSLAPLVSAPIITLLQRF